MLTCFYHKWVLIVPTEIAVKMTFLSPASFFIHSPRKKWSLLLPFLRKSNIKQSIGKLQGISGQNYTFLQLGNFFVVMEGQTLLQTSINQHVDGNSFLFFGDVVISNVLSETVFSSSIIITKALS